MAATFAVLPIYILMRPVKEKVYDVGGLQCNIELLRFNAAR